MASSSDFTRVRKGGCIHEKSSKTGFVKSNFSGFLSLEFYFKWSEVTFFILIVGWNVNLFETTRTYCVPKIEKDEFPDFSLFGLNYFLHLEVEIIAMSRYLFLIKIDVKILNRV